MGQESNLHSRTELDDRTFHPPTRRFSPYLFNKKEHEQCPDPTVGRPIPDTFLNAFMDI